MRRQKRAGFTILEVQFAVVVIIVGFFGLISVFPSVVTLSRSTREIEVATSAIRAELDDMRAHPFPDPANPAGPDIFTTFSGATFTVPGLEPPGSGPQGRVTFLSEAEAATVFAVPLDLDADGRAGETEPASAAFVAYPTRVEVFWSDGTRRAPRGLTMTTVIYSNDR